MTKPRPAAVKRPIPRPAAAQAKALAGLKVELRQAAELKPYARNARTHSEAQVAEIAASIREFGFTNPVLADDLIRAGHGRTLAALKIYAAGESIHLPNGSVLPAGSVPVIDCSGWSETKKRAYVLADNKTALNAGWDDELLRLELGELKDLGVDLGSLGFSDAELAALAHSGHTGLTDPDAAPEPPATPVATRGDLWALGAHRLLCGDATSADDTSKVLAGVSPHLMVTDPPYGVNYDPDWRNRADRANGKPHGARAVGLVTNDDRADWTEAYSLFPGDVAYVWHPPGARQVEFYNSLVASGFDIRMQIIWAKSHFPIGRGNYHVQHEPCWYAVRKRNGATAHWSGDRTQSTLWQIPKPQKSETGHGTQKPVECMKRPIENNSSPGQAVYEPFSGSGTTIIAAEMTGRVCHAIEIDPAYVDVAILRWQEFTGKVAVLQETGETFAQVLGRRVPETVIRPAA